MSSPSICSSQFSSLRFLLQIQVHCFLFINFFLCFFFLPSPFFPKISLSRYEKFSVFTFRPGRNRTIFRTLVHAVSEKQKKKDTALTPESGESYRYVGHRYFAKKGVSVQPGNSSISTSRCVIPFFSVICSGDRFSFLVRNRTISTSSISIEKQVKCQQRVQQVELLSYVNDLYGGVVVNIEKPMDSEVFLLCLELQCHTGGNRYILFNLIGLFYEVALLL